MAEKDEKFKIKLSKEEIRRVNPLYIENLRLWKLYRAIYKGVDALINGDYIPQHEREPNVSYLRRMRELYAFGYSKSVCGIFTYHLMSKPTAERQISKLDDNELWQMFFNDANLYGDAYDALTSQIALQVSIFGHMGVLVDKPPMEGVANLAEQKEEGLYPYMAVYYPMAILDWRFEKDPVTRRPYLSYIKLLEDDGRYRIITKDWWGLYEVKSSKGEVEGPDLTGYQAFAKPTGKQAQGTKGPDTAPGTQPRPVSVPTTNTAGVEALDPIDWGKNEIEQVPFVWYYNKQTDERGIGESDLAEIASLDLSIIKNASQIEEIINYAAFPMLMKPRKDADPKAQDSEADDEVSVQSVVEFDPEHPESKPEWLTPEVESAINSILKNMAHKVAEIYRAANIGGLAGTQVATVAKSGVALKSEFQILNSTLVTKSENLEKAENRVLEFWLKWEELWKEMKGEVKFARAKNFNVEDIAADLENALTAKTLVLSKTFNSILQKQTARQMLPSLSEEEQTTIDQEIDNAVAMQPEPGTTTPENMDDINPEDEDIIIDGTKEDD